MATVTGTDFVYNKIIIRTMLAPRYIQSIAQTSEPLWTLCRCFSPAKLLLNDVSKNVQLMTYLSVSKDCECGLILPAYCKVNALPKNPLCFRQISLAFESVRFELGDNSKTICLFKVLPTCHLPNQVY